MLQLMAVQQRHSAACSQSRTALHSLDKVGAASVAAGRASASDVLALEQLWKLPQALRRREAGWQRRRQLTEVAARAGAARLQAQRQARRAAALRGSAAAARELMQAQCAQMCTALVRLEASCLRLVVLQSLHSVRSLECGLKPPGQEAWVGEARQACAGALGAPGGPRRCARTGTVHGVEGGAQEGGGQEVSPGFRPAKDLRHSPTNRYHINLGWVSAVWAAVFPTTRMLPVVRVLLKVVGIKHWRGFSSQAVVS